MIIGENYKIECDDLQYILLRKRIITGEGCRGRKPKPENMGKEVWDRVAYFSLTLSGLHCLLNKMAALEIAKTELKEFDVVVKKLEDIYDLINKLQPISAYAG